MDNTQIEKLVEAREMLVSVVGASRALNSIVPADHLDEACFIGTPESFVRLVVALLELIIEDAKPSGNDVRIGPESVFGIPVTAGGNVGEVFDAESPVCPLGSYLVRTESDARKLLEAFIVNLDWHKH